MMMSSRREYADKQPYGEWIDSIHGTILRI